MMLEGKDDILSISIGHGFPSAMCLKWAPHPRDQRWRQKPRRLLAERIGRSLIALRGERRTPMVTIDQAIDLALARIADQSWSPIHEIRRRAPGEQYRFCPPA